MKICLDPGHGGQDRANVGPTGYVEADGVLDIALRVRPILTANGHNVIMTRDKDTTVSLAQRVAIANQNNVDLLVSVHSNAGPPQAEGAETFYSHLSSQGKELATQIQKRLVNTLGVRDRGIKTRLGSGGRDYYYMIREPKAVSVITEVAFHTNPREEQLLKTPKFRQQAGEAIAQGIMAYIKGQQGTGQQNDAGGFNDIQGHFAEESIKKAYDLGLVTGYPDGSFKPNQLVTRGELAIGLVRLYEIGKQ